MENASAMRHIAWSTQERDDDDDEPHSLLLPFFQEQPRTPFNVSSVTPLDGTLSTPESRSCCKRVIDDDTLDVGRRSSMLRLTTSQVRSSTLSRDLDLGGTSARWIRDSGSKGGMYLSRFVVRRFRFRVQVHATFGAVHPSLLSPLAA